MPPSPNASASAVASSVAVGAAAAAAYVVPRNIQYYGQTTPTSPFTVFGATANPFMADFVTRTGAAFGANGAVIIPTSSWRPFMYGGNPALPGRRRP